MESKKFCQFLLPKLRGDESVLDVRCGDGCLCNCLAQKLAKPVVGLDVSTRGFAKAHALRKKLNPCKHIECLKGEAEDMARVLRGRRFDVIVFLHSFHHLKDVRAALAQAKKVLKKGGRIIIAEDSIDGGKKKDRCRRFTGAFITGTLMEHFKTITVEEAQNGFWVFTAFV